MKAMYFNAGQAQAQKLINKKKRAEALHFRTFPILLKAVKSNSTYQNPNHNLFSPMIMFELVADLLNYT